MGVFQNSQKDKKTIESLALRFSNCCVSLPVYHCSMNGTAYLYKLLKCALTQYIRNLGFPQPWLGQKLLQSPSLRSPLSQMPPQ